ncbi:hemerythrin domain-containing protein [Sorangium sp. So ce1099]|uniref:hemerythrin domain-containing protein n=1 Tax=Sorangium sp. So ce1099 TaxID=3133331 RepID=UPI003F632DCB
MDSPDLLKTQHVMVEALLAQCKLARSEERRRGIYRRLRAALVMHAEIEEIVFYPACQRREELATLVSGNYDEQQYMRKLLEEMGEVPATSPRFDHLFNELFMLINRHVDEEENALFPRVKRLMRSEERMRLASDMRAYQAARARQPVT